MRPNQAWYGPLSIREIKIVRQGGAAQCMIDRYLHFYGRGIPCILHLWGNVIEIGAWDAEILPPQPWKVSYPNEGALRGGKRLAGYIGGIPGGIGGLLSDTQRGLHVSSLLSGGLLGIVHQGVRSAPELRRIASQDSSYASQDDRNQHQPPFWRRIPIGLLSMFGGGWLYGQGWYYFYKQRRGFGTALIWIGGSLFVFGICLILLLGVRWSWEWWL